MSDPKEINPEKIGTYVAGDVFGGLGKKSRTKIKNLEVIKGNKIKVIHGDNTETEINADDPFFGVYEQIAALPKDKKKTLREVEDIRHEVNKSEDEIREGFLQERLRNLAKMAPDIFEVTVATLANPALGFAILAQKIAKKAKEEYMQSK